MVLNGTTQNLRFLKDIQLIFSKLGLDVGNFNEKKLVINISKFVIILGIFGYFQIALLNFILVNYTHINRITRSMSVSTQALLITLKVLIFLIKGDKFLKLISNMNQLAMKANPQEHQQLLAENRRAQLIGNIYCRICQITAFAGGCAPIMFMAYTYVRNDVFEKFMPFRANFPLDNDGLILYIFNYSCSLVYMYFIIYMAAGIECLYVWYIFNISSHIRILRSKVKEVTLKLKKDVYADIGSLTRDIASIVRYHIKTLEFVNDWTELFRNILGLEVILSCVQMCFVIYTVNNDGNLIFVPLNITSAFLVLTQLMIYCFGGQKIKNESQMLSSDIFLFFPWHKMLPEQRKILLLPLMRSQQLSVLRGIFFEADSSLFVFVTKTAYSFNALLVARRE